jgi:hypothetical protein
MTRDAKHRGWSLRMMAEQNTFIFQSVPERFDLRTSLRAGKSDTWYATRYRNEMRPGDLVLFWMGGSEDIRGLYGWGHIASEPYLKKSWDAHGVDVVYDVRFAVPVLATDIRDSGSLSELLIFRAPSATNFLLSEDESVRLAKLIKKNGETPPSPGGL